MRAPSASPRRGRGWPNSNPAASSRPGRTRWPLSTMSSAISAPRASLRANAGTASTTGRWRAAPRALASSASVAGAGAVALTGPERPGVLEAVEDGRDLVVEGDPAAVLAAGPGPAAQPQPEERELLAERPAGRAEHDAGAQEDRPDAGLGGRRGGLLPGRADLGQEPGPGRRLLVSTSSPRSP